MYGDIYKDTDHSPPYFIMSQGLTFQQVSAEQTEQTAWQHSNISFLENQSPDLYHRHTAAKTFSVLPTSKEGVFNITILQQNLNKFAVSYSGYAGNKCGLSCHSA